MGRFFEEVEFEEPRDVGVEIPKTRVVWDKQKLAEAESKIMDEIGRIRVGTSNYVSRAIDPGKFGFPAQNAIKVFLAEPSDKTFEGVRDICCQDFTAKAGDYFYNLLKVARSEVPNE